MSADFVTRSWIERPLAHVIRFLFQADDRIRVFDFGDEQTFYNLWLNGLAGHQCMINGDNIDWATDHVVVLIGTSPPAAISDDVPAWLVSLNFSGQLNALSWVAAWRVRFPDARSRVVLVDTAEPQSSVAQALATIFSARRVDSGSIIAGVAYVKSPSLSELSDLLAPAAERDADVSSGESLVRTILWSGLTSDREGHHAISNIVGALLLRRGTGSDDATASRLELVLERVVQAAVGNVSNHRTGTSWWRKSGNHPRTQFAVLDDMADLWSPFLQSALGLADNDRLLTLPGAAFADAIVDVPGRLDAFLQRRSGQLSAADLAEPWPRCADFVLFLDLRLFPGARADGSNEDSRSLFQSRLVEFGFHLLDSGRQLPWLTDQAKRAMREELQTMERAPAPVRGGPCSAAQIALPPNETLFPRLVSLLDPTLPIIIFSSTHRSELTEPFLNYENIITAFRKPTVSGLVGDWDLAMDDLCLDFGSTMDRAAKILQGRRLLQALL